MSSKNTSLLTRLKNYCAHAFAVSPPESAITKEDEILAEKAAAFIVGAQTHSTSHHAT